MSNEVEVEVKEKKVEKLTKKDITIAWARWYAYSEVSNNFERLQALAYCGSMTGILEKLYTSKEELSVALKRHLSMFNTQATWGSVINGITIALEEEHSLLEEDDELGMTEEESAETITGMKIGLMGPIAGIGDTLDFGTIRPILMGIFIPFALNGSVIAALAPLIIQSLYMSGLGYVFFHRGYSVGKKSIMAILQSGRIQQVISGAGVLGMFMMGSLSATFVRLSTPLEITTELDTISVQGVFDSIAPSLLPLIAVFLIYFYLVKVGPKFIRIITFVMIFALVGAFIGFL